MKLLICTQKVDINDSVLGFFHRWLLEFAKHSEKLTVICLEKGEYSFPENVRVLSLGKEEGLSKFKSFWQLYKYIWKYRKDYDTVFVHMNPEYVVFAGWLWKLLGKKINLWYVHRQVNLKLRYAVLFCKNIFTVAFGSIGLRNKKVRFVGHGIDTELFKCGTEKSGVDVFKIISVGRITRIKNLDTLVKAVGFLRGKFSQKFVVELVGEPVTNDDREYKKELEEIIKNLSLQEIVKFTGVRFYGQLPDLYCQSDLLINLAPTGGLDKVVLEAMSSGLPILVCNNSFIQFLGGYAERLSFKYNDISELAEKIIYLLNNPDPKLNSYLREVVVNNHDLAKLVEKISNQLWKK